MAKIESIRPSGTLEGSFSEYPIAELLIGLLRGNLSGRLELFFGQTRANEIYFKDGVPVCVDLPDLGVSVARILLERGVIAKDVAFEILKQAEESGRTESALIVEERILSEGAILDARRRRAHGQMVRLFDAAFAEFRFTEGAGFREDATLTVLQPLPIVFEGLRSSSDRTLVERFLEKHGDAQYKLGATYPRGVDPFEWGDRVEAIIASLEDGKTLAELTEAGLPVDLAAVALTTLHLAGMIDVMRAGQSAKGRSTAEDEAGPPVLEYMTPRPDGPSRGRGPPRAEGSPDPADEDKEPSGLVVVRRSSGAVERPRSNPRNAPLEPGPERKDPSGGFRSMSRSEAESAQSEVQLEQIAVRINPLKGKSYFKVLRLADGASQEQIERSFRHLVHQLDEHDNDPAVRALRDLYVEAYEVLMHPSDGRRYRELNDRAKSSGTGAAERQAFEATQKVDRAVRAMAEGRVTEAMFLLDWALQLEPARKDVKAYRGLVRYFRAPRTQRSAEAHALKPVIAQEVQRAPHDRTMILCLALLTAEEKDALGAEQLIGRAEKHDHPLVRRIREVLSGH